MSDKKVERDLAQPTSLRRSAIISFYLHSKPFHVVCFACSVIRLREDGADTETDWVYAQGYQGGPANPSGDLATRLYLIPARYVIQVRYGGRYRITSPAVSATPEIIQPTHPAPDGALPLKELTRIIQSLQVPEGPGSPMLYNDYVREVSNRFEQALIGIRAIHNFDLGDEFEIAMCETLRLVLPQRYGLCRGFVVSTLGETAGDDIIIFDRMRFPTIRSLESDTFTKKEQVPIEAVFAYIEAKHSITIEGDGGTSFQKALTQVGRVKILCDRRTSVPYGYLEDGQPAPPPADWPEIMNPAYGAIVCRHVRLKEGSDPIEDPEEIQRHVLASRAATLAPPDFCVFGKNNMMIPVLPIKGSDRTHIPSPFFLNGKSQVNTCVVDGVAFGAGLSLLLWALARIYLDEMPWPAILEDCIPPPTDRQK
jgi:hypothetical protein